MNLPKDYTPTAETISLHGLGFIQIKLGAGQRLHVWHPDLPRRECFHVSAVHNHRFSFRSLVLKGEQVNRCWDAVIHPEGEFDVISHDGPRSPRGGRESYVAGRVNLIARPAKYYVEGQSYEMPELAYHDTPNDGIVVTLMTKLTEGDIHATSIIRRPHVFDQGFDRFQLSPDELFAYVADALR